MPRRGGCDGADRTCRTRAATAASNSLFRRSNAIFASFRSRNGEARKIAEKFQGGGHANAAGALLPKSIRTVEDGLDFPRQMLNPKQEPPLNNLENLFAGLKL